MDIIIRLEQQPDYRSVEELTREAFWNHYSPGCDEHYLVHIMRDSKAFVRELDFVAVYNDEIIGNIMYTEGSILGDDGEKQTVLCFGPISVLPKYQGMGVGGKLIEHSKKVARDLGYEAILIFGDPQFYKRVGFIEAEKYFIGTSWNTYAAALLACELIDGALNDCRGRFIDDDVYNIDKDCAEAFDKRFIQKQKVEGLQSQARFNQLVAMSKPRV